LIEDYLLVPRIIGPAMKIPALITVVAVLIGRPAWDRRGAGGYPHRRCLSVAD
jgi:hypothetical protein